jgi:nicotinamidase/pyrazinamidase
MLWPNHCVQGSNGAAFHADLDLKPVSLIIRKGSRKDLDSYSAFFENDRCTSIGLEGGIKQMNVETVIIGGLATDYCVFYSAMDSRRLGFNTIVVSDAVKGVGIPEGSVESAVEAMKSSGIKFLSSVEILDQLK